MAEDVPVVRIVDTLIKHAIIQNASDIHIEQGELEVVVRHACKTRTLIRAALPRRSTASRSNHSRLH
jgi:type II secretory ATPase GspE/PulE/Tfp pilus assembly ATPase PilB-like protein